MEDQIPPSQQPAPAPQPRQPDFNQTTLEQLEQMKAMAREAAIRQAMEQRQVTPPQSGVVPPQPKVVYVRRNLTVAEVILLFLLATTAVVGFQSVWGLVANHLPRIEVKVK
jgi:hypothetical protein